MPTIIKDVTVIAPEEECPDWVTGFPREAHAHGCHVAVWTEDGSWMASHRDGVEPSSGTNAWWPDAEAFHQWIRGARS